MKKKLSVYLLALSMLLSLLIPMAPAQAAGAQEINISDKMGGLQPLIATEMSDEKAAELLQNVSATEYYATPQDRAYWNQFSNDYYYHYFLNDAEKAFWNALKEKSFEMAVTTNYYSYYDDYVSPSNASLVMYDPSISRNRMIEIVLMFEYSNPQYYFLHNGFWFNSSSGALWLCTYEEFADGNARQAATQQYLNRVELWLADIKSQVRPDEKIKRAHDIMCQNTIYSFDGLHQSSYSLVCQGVTVCAGYSKTTNLLLNAAGIESVVMLGPDHAWNAVQVHDNWYELDVTWDDADNSDVCYYWCYNKSWETFVDNGHVKESPYTKINLNQVYDSEHYGSYINPYFTSGGNTYYVVNDNTALGQRLVKRVEGTAALPQTVSYNSKTYYVMPEAGANASVVNEQQIRAFVERMYTVALGRSAEADGLNFYTNLLIAGDSNGACLAESFLCSPEFLNKGHSNEQYVKVLYKTFFNREPASSEVSYWVDMLKNGKSKAFVLSGFVNSNEFDSLCTSYGIARGYMMPETGKPINPGIGRFAERLYTKVLGREGEKEGVEYWSIMIATGACTPQQAAASMFASAEYQNKKTSNVQYIETLYRTFMGREPEVGGVSYWKNLLTNGTSREHVLNGFADSAEFKGIMQSFGL